MVLGTYYACCGVGTNATMPAWKGECTKYTPTRERGSNFGELHLQNPGHARLARKWVGKVCNKTELVCLTLEHH